MSRLLHISPRFLALFLAVLVALFLVLQGGAMASSSPSMAQPQHAEVTMADMGHEDDTSGHCETDNDVDVDCSGSCCCVMTMTFFAAPPSSPLNLVNVGGFASSATVGARPSAPPPRDIG